jgi:arsenite transporter
MKAHKTGLEAERTMKSVFERYLTVWVGSASWAASCWARSRPAGEDAGRMAIYVNGAPVVSIPSRSASSS